MENKIGLYVTDILDPTKQHLNSRVVSKLLLLRIISLQLLEKWE